MGGGKDERGRGGEGAGCRRSTRTRNKPPTIYDLQNTTSGSTKGNRKRNAGVLDEKSGDKRPKHLPPDPSDRWVRSRSSPLTKHSADVVCKRVFNIEAFQLLTEEEQSLLLRAVPAHDRGDVDNMMRKPAFQDWVRHCLDLLRDGMLEKKARKEWERGMNKELSCFKAHVDQVPNEEGGDLLALPDSLMKIW